MQPEQIARINELARLSRERALTPLEDEERAALRAAYIREYRKNMELTLANVRIREQDGTLTPLRKKEEPPEAK